MAQIRHPTQDPSEPTTGGSLPWASLLASFAVIVLTVASAFVGMTICKDRVAASGLSVNVKGRGMSVGAGEVQLWSADNSFSFSSAETKTRQWPRYVGGPDGWHVGLHPVPEKFLEQGKVLFASPGVRYEAYNDGARGAPSAVSPSTWVRQTALTVSGGVIVLTVAAPWLCYEVIRNVRRKRTG